MVVAALLGVAGCSVVDAYNKPQSVVTVTASPEPLPAYRGPLTLESSKVEGVDFDSKTLTGGDAEIDFHALYIDERYAVVDFEIMNGAKFAEAPGQVNSRAECEAMAKSGENVLISPQPDDILCVRTSNGTVARLQVIEFGKESVTLDATVWRR
ncbi:hypothetical protein [Nonomuraea turcica]|uniref:hypothetical protein n=1 Tax=Nonomuraea sp. G32 TaxID=3067274 RepID=UPI00273CD68D|nr:hypothetical protein [Nonomuraea sp. G32]MDP4511515.1 hypothetical protein [Nonomuraea sp. G32]